MIVLLLEPQTQIQTPDSPLTLSPSPPLAHHLSLSLSINSQTLSRHCNTLRHLINTDEREGDNKGAEEGEVKEEEDKAKENLKRIYIIEGI